MNKTLFLPALAAAALVSTAGLAQEVVLRAATGLPSNNEFTQRFLAYVEAVNAAGEGVVRIQVVGGPEAVPSTQQDTALRNGVIDMQAGPSSFYVGTVPEAGALKGATVTVTEARENGAFDELNAAWRDKLGAELIAWLGEGVGFYVYLSQPPVFTEDGALDLAGLTLRSAPTYRDWFDSMGATSAMLQQAEIFTALERGVVQGFGWPAFVSDISAGELLAARVAPAVWQNDVVVMVNAARWDGLTQEARDVLAEAAAAIEAENIEYYARRLAEEQAELEEAGVELVEIPGEAGARHVADAHNIVWAELEQVAPDSAATLRPLMYPEN